MQTVGLIGIGLVGTALAQHLFARGYAVVGFDTDAARMTAFTAMGGASARSPADVAQQARRIVLALPDSNVVAQVVAGPQGLLTATTLPQVIIDTSTGDPDDTIAVAQRLAARGVAYVDATLSGSSEQVRAREAVLMIGGAPDVVDAQRDILAALADRMFHLGPVGSGAKAKLASNLVLGLNRLVLAEGLVFAAALGLDLPRFLALLKASPAYSVAMDVKGDKMLRDDFAPQSRVHQHRKDVAMMLQHAAAAGQPLPLSRVHLQLLDAAIAAGDGELDNAAVIRELRRRRTP